MVWDQEAAGSNPVAQTNKVMLKPIKSNPQGNGGSKMREFNYNTIMVHAGTFHADDVMAVAIAKEINPNIKVERVFRVPDDVPTTTLVADIGFGEFDHHQPNAKLREDGNKRAACGLIFEQFGYLLFSEKGREYFEKSYIIPIEDGDNGNGTNPLSSIISAFNPFWDSTDPVKETQEGFDYAVELCRLIIRQTIMKSASMDRAESAVEKALKTMKPNGLAVLSSYIPPVMFVGTEAKLLIAPSNRGGYNILTVKVNKDTFEDVISLPESWVQNKPEGCTFVHVNRFIAAFDKLEDAVKAAESVL